MAAVISPQDHLAMHWYTGCAQLICRIERVALDAHLAELLGHRPSAPLRFEPAMDVSRGWGRSFSARLRGLVSEIDRHSGVVDHPWWVREFEHGLMTHLLFAQPNTFSDELHADATPAPSRLVRQAVGLLESHPEWPHTIGELARTLGTSARALQRGFQSELGVGFRALLRDIRLRRVHDELRAGVPESVSVNDVLARWGLPLAGHTFAAYRRQFGETPAVTLGRGL